METPFDKAAEADPISPTGNSLLVVRLIGFGLILCAVLMLLSTIAPFLLMWDFLPASMIVEQVFDFLKLSHASVFTLLLAIVGGLFLLFARRIGWMLGLGSIFAVQLLWLEGILIGIYSVMEADEGLGTFLGFGWEMVELLYYAPLIQFGLQVACLIGLLMRGTRNVLQVKGKHFLVPIAIAILVVVEQNLLLLLLSMSNG